MFIEQDLVEDFHIAMGQPVAEEPTLIPAERVNLRYALIEEELGEYRDAALDGDLPGVADAIADMLYVVLGTAAEHGIFIEPIFRHVHAANMRKLDESGEPVPHPTIPGKTGKPDGWYGPEQDIEAELEAQSLEG